MKRILRLGVLPAILGVIQAQSLLAPSTIMGRAPDVYRARFTTTKGDIVIEVTRSWAPIGADRFYNLVNAGFYSDTAFHRVIPRFMAQFGISPRPDIARAWINANIVDEPVRHSNLRGTVAFAAAGPNTRTTQVFINYGNNARLDSAGFAPFGEVIEGMDTVVDNLFSGYGESPDQGAIQQLGRPYLDGSFPRLDRIISAVIVPVESPVSTSSPLTSGGAPLPRPEIDTCLPYQSPLTFKGHIVSHQGLRNWWGLALDRPVCMVKDGSDTYGQPYVGVLEMQLILMAQGDYDRYRGLVGKDVSISGKLTPRMTGYHETNVLIVVHQITGKDGDTGSAVKQNQASPLPNLPSYVASVTVLPAPTNRVIKQAWQKETPDTPLAESDSYISHLFNGPKDIVWVQCRAGYLITRATSGTASSVFQMQENIKTSSWGVAVSDSKRTNITVECLRTGR